MKYKFRYNFLLLFFFTCVRYICMNVQVQLKTHFVTHSCVYIYYICGTHVVHVPGYTHKNKNELNELPVRVKSTQSVQAVGYTCTTYYM
jgi:hypothetical protein